MIRSTIACALLALPLVLAAPPLADAQQAPARPSMQQPSQTFDSERFFEELKLRGVSMNEGFDGEKFFEKLRLDGVSDEKPLDAEAFFERLRLEGVNMPEKFDAQKFFDELASRGVAGPSMVAPTAGGPTAAECQAGWQSTGKWDRSLFDRLCQARK